MIYKSCSIDETIGRVIRNTRVQDTAFLIDMHEWIPEAMELMHTKHQYSYAYEDVEIKFHKGKMPCGLIWIEAVEWCGTRLRHGNSVKNITTGRANPFESNTPSVFISKVEKKELPDGNFIYTSTLEAVKELPLATDEWYQTEMDRILTSFSDDYVRIHFVKIPTDQRGFPLIPDNANYKQAIYWYTRGKMIEAGFQDSVIRWEVAQQQFEFYAARAVSEIDYPSPDQMQDRVERMNQLVLPTDYFDTFFRSNPEQPYTEL